MGPFSRRIVFIVVAAATACGGESSDGGRKEDGVGDAGDVCADNAPRCGYTTPPELLRFGDPTLDGLFGAIDTAEARSRELRQSLDADLAELARLHGVDASGPITSSLVAMIVASIEEDAAAHVSGGITIALTPPTCAPSAALESGSKASCESRVCCGAIACEARAGCAAAAHYYVLSHLDCAVSPLDFSYTLAASITAEAERSFAARVVQLEALGTSILLAHAELEAIARGELFGVPVLEPAPLAAFRDALGTALSAEAGGYIPPECASLASVRIAEAAAVLSGLDTEATSQLVVDGRLVALLRGGSI